MVVRSFGAFGFSWGSWVLLGPKFQNVAPADVFGPPGAPDSLPGAPDSLQDGQACSWAARQALLALQTALLALQTAVLALQATLLALPTAPARHLPALQTAAAGAPDNFQANREALGRPDKLPWRSKQLPWRLTDTLQERLPTPSKTTVRRVRLIPPTKRNCRTTIHDITSE